MAAIIAQMTEGFLLGIATGTTCLATCGPIYAPYLMLSERTLKSSFLTILEISGGRFITYLIVGLFAGLLHKNLNILGDSVWFTACAYLSFSTYLIFSALRPSRRKLCCQRAAWYSFADRPVLLGLLTGINFCPSFLLAFTKAVNLSGPLAGMVLFGAFFMGTSLFLLPLSYFGVVGKQPFLRRIAKVSALVVGGWFVVQAVLIIIRRVV
jgi:sulfite exporter TauE/SafE